MMVKVVGFYQGPDGQDREGVAIGGGLVRENDGSVGEAKPGEEVIFFDAHWQPIRPPAPEEHGERAEHLAGVVQ